MVTSFGFARVSSNFMNNLNLIRRFIFGSLIMGAIIPLSYHIGEEYFRANHFKVITEQACKAIEPMIQKGSQREPLEYLTSAISNQGSYADPEILMQDHDHYITPEVKNTFDKNVESCNFSGISGVQVKVYYARVPLLNIAYLYMYLFSVPLMFCLFTLARWIILKLQRKVADIIEFQMKQLFNLNEVSSVKPQSGVLYRLLELEIPLLKYLKTHIDSLENDLKIYSQKIADQQRKEVLKDVASQMAHEILTPISNLQIILKDQSSVEKRDLLLLELAQIKSLSENLLREYRGDKTAPESSKKKVDVLETVQTVIEGTKLFAHEKTNIKIKLNNHIESEKLFILADRSQFVAAISNLLRNSVEALKNDDGLVQVDISKLNDHVVIKVRDNGCGIKPENLSKIFEKRFSDGKQNGTGLGLCQVQSAIDSMNGTIDVQSKVNEFTQFEIKIPISFSQKITTTVVENADLVLIDDSYTNHLVWQIEASRHNKSVAVFFNETDFLNSKFATMTDLPIFVDCIFDDDNKAGLRIVDDLKSKGFKKLYIATGLTKDSIIAPSGVKVVGKEFPITKLV